MITPPKKPSTLVEVVGNVVGLVLLIALVTMGCGVSCRLFMWSAGL